MIQVESILTWMNVVILQKKWTEDLHEDINDTMPEVFVLHV